MHGVRLLGLRGEAMIRVETKGSYWDIDEDRRLYRRWNKVEDVRRDDWGEARPEWSDQRAGALEDGVWHPYARWEIKSWGEVLREHLESLGRSDPLDVFDDVMLEYMAQPDLIFYNDEGRWICRAPDAKVQSGD